MASLRLPAQQQALASHSLCQPLARVPSKLWPRPTAMGIAGTSCIGAHNLYLFRDLGITLFLTLTSPSPVRREQATHERSDALPPTPRQSSRLHRARRHARHLPARLAPARPRHGVPALRRRLRRAGRHVRPGLHATTVKRRPRARAAPRRTPRVPARHARVPRASCGGRRGGARGVRARHRVAARGQLGRVPHVGGRRVFARELGWSYRAQGCPVGPGRTRCDGRRRGRHCRVEPRYVPCPSSRLL